MVLYLAYEAEPQWLNAILTSFRWPRIRLKVQSSLRQFMYRLCENRSEESIFTIENLRLLLVYIK